VANRISAMDLDALTATLAGMMTLVTEIRRLRTELAAREEELDRLRAASGLASPPPPTGDAPADQGNLDEVFGRLPARPSRPTTADEMPPAPTTPPVLSLVDVVMGELMSGQTMAAYNQARAEMEKLRADEREFVVPGLIGCLLRVLEHGPDGDVDPAMATLSKFRAAKLLTRDDEATARRLHGLRKAAP
jgi:hypothetical protein